ncbi:hypothetical protein OIDMADRAFT_21143 [Oidiodendron maius Zn]|uniref:Uncharacterized protein n=1 Tax=Oidiodendron maius (strain Zn) TaxID=913774 RepID=A0A0C3GVW8_OIDMZ|nr:hypothetical protein OIDMADRAFT_21143 [Oidiodendron maius Zn]
MVDEIGQPRDPNVGSAGQIGRYDNLFTSCELRYIPTRFFGLNCVNIELSLLLNSI